MTIVLFGAVLFFLVFLLLWSVERSRAEGYAETADFWCDKCTEAEDELRKERDARIRIQTSMPRSKKNFQRSESDGSCIECKGLGCDACDYTGGY